MYNYVYMHNYVYMYILHNRNMASSEIPGKLRFE